MSQLRLTRREVLTVGALAAAGGALTVSGALRSVRGAPSSPSVELPSGGAAFVEPGELRFSTATDGVREAQLSVSATHVTVAEERVELLTYNGRYPGPLIRLRPGDRLRLVLRNDLPPGDRNLLGVARGVTNLHTHGLHVSPSDPADNTMRHVLPGESWTYTYDLARHPPGTMAWYHPHVHGLVAEQLWAGLAGPLIVEDAGDTLGRFETHTLVLKDFSFSGRQPSPYASPMDFMMGKVGPVITVNGLVAPVLSARPGQVQRWRVLNASTSRFYRLSLERHILHVVGSDGGLLDRPYPMDTLLLAPGERVDLLVKAADDTGSYRLMTLPHARGSAMGGMMGGALGDSGMVGGGMMDQTLPASPMLTLRVRGAAQGDVLPSEVDPQARRALPDLSSAVRRRFVLGMHMGRASINGQDFDGAPLVVRSRLAGDRPTWEVWTIANPTGMDHPWHQHTNHAQVLAVSGGDRTYADLYTTAPAWKDTVIVPRGGSVTQLVRVADWRGEAMVHCHIVEHEDIGMLGVWQIT